MGINFELGPIRPPAEANSLCVRTTRGCTWNKCHFCEHYENMSFSIRSIAEIEHDIIESAKYYSGYNFTNCFLQDGDSFVMKTKDMLKVLELIKKHFPTIKQVSSYGYPSTIARKDISEMKEIRDAGLTRLYCGMESGSDIILDRVEKGTTAKEIIKAGLMSKEAGIEISEFIIIGLGGKELSEENARETARVLNEIDPDFIRARSIGVKATSKLGQSMREGSYILQSEEELVLEQRLLIESLEDISSFYTSDHSINLLMDIEGRVPMDKARMLGVIDQFMGLTPDERINFSFGRRFGYYRSVNDFLRSDKKNIVSEKIVHLRNSNKDLEIKELSNLIRERMM